MKIAVIGAGTAGLISLKYAIDEGYECDAFEQTGEIGGLWVYREETVDENGLPVGSPLYKDLRTNLPKEGMAYLDFPYPQISESFIEHRYVLEYLQMFTKHFGLERYIKFYSRVTHVEPTQNNKWSLTITNVTTQNEECKEYDAVFICNGHHNIGNMPNIPGQDVFRGTQMHSIDFRKADDYKDKRVLIIGGSISGSDIAQMISEVSQYVCISHYGKYIAEPAPSIDRKPAVSRLEVDGAVFVDESRESFDAVIYCTGYNFVFPFLAESCGIQIEGRWIKHLYKHIVNIEHPTMYFIGLIDAVMIATMFDIQARFAFASLKQHFRLPSKQDMKKDEDEYIKTLQEEGFSLKYIHRLVFPGKLYPYIQDLAATANIRPIPKVMNKMCESVLYHNNQDRHFTIVDEENFTSM